MMHWFDLFVAFFLLISGVWSYYRGFARELFSLLSILFGYFVASTYYLDAANALQDVTPGKTAAEIVGFVVLFILAVATVVVAGILVRRLLHSSETMTSIDKIAGFGVGLLKGGLILAIIAYPLALIPGPQKKMTAGSLSFPILVTVSNSLLEKLAPGMADNLAEVGEKSPQTAKKAKKSIKKITKQLGSVGSLIGGVTGKVTDTIIDMTSKVLPPDAESKSEKETAAEDRKEMNRLIESVDE